MASGFRRLAGIAAVIGFAISAVPANAYLYWTPPDFSGGPVKGDEPGMGVDLPGATPKELTAHLLWNMRAGLNVAALQCQFAPALMTVPNYNALLFNHSKELTAAFATLSGYFKRQSPKASPKVWQTALDQYTTRTYNGFSTMHAQRGFCEVAGSIGRDALDEPKGKLFEVAQNRMREFRNSLTPQADRVFYFSQGLASALPADVDQPPVCTNKRGKVIACKA